MPGDIFRKLFKSFDEGRAERFAACPRPAANFALPANTGKAWSKARLVDLEELETEELALDANGAVNLDITKKKIITIEFLP